MDRDRAIHGERDRRHRALRSSGFTLLELLVALAITAAVVVAATAWTTAAIRATEVVSSRPDHGAAIEALRRLIEDDLRLGDATPGPEGEDDASEASGAPREGVPADGDLLASEQPSGEAPQPVLQTPAQTSQPSTGRARPKGAAGTSAAGEASDGAARKDGAAGTKLAAFPAESPASSKPPGRRDMIETLAGRLRIRARSRDMDRPGEVVRDYAFERGGGRVLIRERRPSGSITARPALDDVRDWRCEIVEDRAILVVAIEFLDGTRSTMRIRLP